MFWAYLGIPFLKHLLKMSALVEVDLPESGALPDVDPILLSKSHLGLNGSIFDAP